MNVSIDRIYLHKQCVQNIQLFIVMGLIIFTINLVYYVIFKEHIFSILLTEKVHSSYILLPLIFLYVKEYSPLQRHSSGETILNGPSDQLQ